MAYDEVAFVSGVSTMALQICFIVASVLCLVKITTLLS